MKKSGVVYLGNSKFIALVRENLIIVIFTLIFALGTLISTVFIGSESLKNLSEGFLDLFLKNRISVGFFSQFLFSFVFSFIFIFSAFIFGTSLLGIAFVPFIIFSRGIFSGLLLAALYTDFGLIGIAVNLLSVLPGTIVCVLALINVSSDSMNLSYQIGKTVIGNGQNIYKFNITRLLKKYSLALIITAIGSLFEVILFNLFQNFFALG
ncbi:MAG: hypothetical protein U0L72_05230 [Acutalibacteraceae bacterium]|nr:hypothetical protein [Acutalibacteraceae bacterium]